MMAYGLIMLEVAAGRVRGDEADGEGMSARPGASKGSGAGEVEVNSAGWEA
jgi:hypothetical protein